MISESSHQTWFLDQLTKSEFFHQKLHEWRMLSVAEAIESFRGETLEWDLPNLGISPSAWNKVIHRGIKPVTVFAHPEVLMCIPGSTGYYRMLSMVSQKSMARVGLGVNAYETGASVPDQMTAGQIASHLNQIISRLIEFDEEVSAREFDLWRGMAAGTQAQGSWQNAKGERVEALMKGLIQRRLRERGWVVTESADGRRMELSDGRQVIFGDEPDIAFYKGGRIRAAVEVKGGIDPAGILERLGAAMKSLTRAREENPTAVAILVIQGTSLTERARADLELHRHTITHWFTVESILTDEATRAEVFELLNI
ncbi:MAG: XcyI family restriction endonuclease [Anaerolineae bacterium]|nr:XcyI family restriction endonuclease [Anaerolineae bacterium]